MLRKHSKIILICLVSALIVLVGVTGYMAKAQNQLALKTKVASVSPSPKPTITPTPTVTPSPTVTPTATPTPTAKSTVKPKTVVKQNAVTPSPTPAPTTTPTVHKIVYTPYTFASIDESKVIKNSPRFNVTIDSNSIKGIGRIKCIINNYKNEKLYFKDVVSYGDEGWSTDSNYGFLNDNGIYSYTLCIGKYDPQNYDSVICHVFIKPDGESNYYEYDFKINVTQ